MIVTPDAERERRARVRKANGQMGRCRHDVVEDDCVVRYGLITHPHKGAPRLECKIATENLHKIGTHRIVVGNDRT